MGAGGSPPRPARGRTADDAPAGPHRLIPDHASRAGPRVARIARGGQWGRGSWPVRLWDPRHGGDRAPWRSAAADRVNAGRRRGAPRARGAPRGDRPRAGTGATVVSQRPVRPDGTARPAVWLRRARVLPGTGP
ncbi:hypothetical protein FRACA_660016 [Frankia canadensis]|uniref:Uncharacterized protein n=1 Tax=Frankia canadensis TaxID=1836972 RepID=A0A2I2L039_9ACTN|nr:hypothetical protein FRACA_660016 [Frankia canadensis]SOU58574.1 hypothetical protein FRACA_660016 [Frankia canadensis]